MGNFLVYKFLNPLTVISGYFLISVLRIHFSLMRIRSGIKMDPDPDPGHFLKIY